jgi:hypothetical protein
MGFMVLGLSGGGRGSGRSGSMLYQWVGRSSTGSNTLTSFVFKIESLLFVVEGVSYQLQLG